MWKKLNDILVHFKYIYLFNLKGLSKSYRNTLNICISFYTYIYEYLKFLNVLCNCNIARRKKKLEENFGKTLAKINDTTIKEYKGNESVKIYSEL